MKALVAVKRVPDGNVPLRFKQDGSGIDPAGMPMRINPFDESALEAAVRLKESGHLTEIIAVSIGPDTCNETLRHALALGADRAIRIESEQVLEPLAVAKLLQALAEREHPDLVLLGKQSSDTDQAQTGPMLAALLGWPQGAFASALAFEDQKLVVTREIEGGQEALALALPAVVTADLRLANPRYLKLPQLLQAKKKPVEALTCVDLGLEHFASRQELLQVSAPPPRQPARKVCDATELLTCLREEGLLNDKPKTELKLETTTAQGRALVLAEHEGGRLHPSVRHAVGAARCLANEVVLLVVGEAVLAIEAATLAGVSRVLHVDVAHFAQTLAEDHAPLLAQAARDLQVDTVLAAATPFGKALLPRAAALLDSAMLSDVVQILAPDRFVRPIHAGEALATIRDTQPLRIMSVRPAAFAPVADQAAVSIESLATPAPAGKACWLSTSQPERNRPALADARIVIAGGRGLGSAEQFRALIEPLADRLNAAIGATRAAVDAGFIGNDHQIGQTGAIVAPEFYFAIGLSGAAQHLAGMRDSRVIVAINCDPAAPICRHADYVLEGDLQRILPELLALLEK